MFRTLLIVGLLLNHQVCICCLACGEKESAPVEQAASSCGGCCAMAEEPSDCEPTDCESPKPPSDCDCCVMGCDTGPVSFIETKSTLIEPIRPGGLLPLANPTIGCGLDSHLIQSLIGELNVWPPGQTSTRLALLCAWLN